VCARGFFISTKLRALFSGGEEATCSCADGIARANWRAPEEREKGAAAKESRGQKADEEEGRYRSSSVCRRSQMSETDSHRAWSACFFILLVDLTMKNVPYFAF
jgi:hypothetical protein